MKWVTPHSGPQPLISKLLQESDNHCCICFRDAAIYELIKHATKWLNIRGWVNKSLEKSIKTVLIFVFFFISQHNLLGAQYTWLDVSQFFLNHQKNKFSEGPQNKHLSDR
jgi:hypothetical protein